MLERDFKDFQIHLIQNNFKYIFLMGLLQKLINVTNQLANFMN